MELDSIDKAVIDFFDKESGRWFFIKKPPVTLATRLEEDLRMLWEDAEELAEKFFESFDVDGRAFDIFEYMGNDPMLLCELFYLITKRKRIEKISKTPLTVGMFAEAAKLGYWW